MQVLWILLTLTTLLGLSRAAALPAQLVQDDYYNHAEVFAGGSIIGAQLGDTEQQVNGNFVIVNQCYFDLYVWEAWRQHLGQADKIPARTAFRKELIVHYSLPLMGPGLHACLDNCGVTYHITKEPGKLSGGPGGNEVQFEYATKNGTLYYDISFVDCAKNLGYRTGDASNCPVWAEGIRIDHQNSPHDFGCGTLECRPREMCIFDKAGAYFVDEPDPKWGFKDPVQTCSSYGRNMELYFRTCTQNPDL